MSDFGDAEPEDSWDADDSPAEHLNNLRRRLGVRAEDARAARPVLARLRVDLADLAFVIAQLEALGHGR